MKKLNIWILLVSVAFILGILFGGYIIFFKKFCKEYYLQNKIDEYSDTSEFQNEVLGNDEMIYVFDDNSGINLEIKINSKGYISLGHHNWSNEEHDHENYVFKIDRSLYQELKKDFENAFKVSEVVATNSTFNSEYRMLRKKSGNNDVEVVYYNQKPNEDFKKIRDEFIEIGNKVFEETEL